MNWVQRCTLNFKAPLAQPGAPRTTKRLSSLVAAGRGRAPYLMLCAAMLLGGVSLIGCTSAALASQKSSGQADAERSVQRLAERLKSGSDFRVKTQAALELGKTKHAAARAPLEGALTDKNSSVRAAAAAALKVLGEPAALPALRKHSGDSVKSVRAAVEDAIAGLEAIEKSKQKDPQVVVTLGKVSNGTDERSPDIVKALRTTGRKKLAELPEVALKQPNPKKKLPEIMLSGRLVSLTQSVEGSEVVLSGTVEYVIHAMPGRTIRGKLSGKASARATSKEVKDQKQLAQLKRDVVDAAIGSALRRAPEAVLAAAQ